MERTVEKRFDNPLDDAETFRLNSSSFLSEIGGTPTSLSEIEGQYMGLLRISPKAWSEIKRVRESLDIERSDNIHMTDMLQMIIDEGIIDIEALPYEQEWAEFDSPNDLRYFPNLDGAISLLNLARKFSNLPVCYLAPYGRGGSVFMQGIFDGHPQVLQIPTFFQFVELSSKAPETTFINCKNKIKQELCNKYKISVNFKKLEKEYFLYLKYYNSENQIEAQFRQFTTLGRLNGVTVLVI